MRVLLNIWTMLILTLNALAGYNVAYEFNSLLADLGFTAELDPLSDFGQSCTSIGDVDNNNHPELAVGDPTQSVVYLLWMDAVAPLVPSFNVIHSVSEGFTAIFSTDDKFGSSITALGDLNGDSTYDMAVGAMNLNNETGIRYIYIYIILVFLHQSNISFL